MRAKLADLTPLDPRGGKEITDEEQAILCADGWYWHTRGGVYAYGPFETFTECRQNSIDTPF